MHKTEVTYHQMLIIRHVSYGLHYLHEETAGKYGKKSILHGDLKPFSHFFIVPKSSNIILKRNKYVFSRSCILIEFRNNNLCAKISDFSQSKEIELKNNPQSDAELRDEIYKFGLVLQTFSFLFAALFFYTHLLNKILDCFQHDHIQSFKP